jgi:hypothetical protein
MTAPSRKLVTQEITILLYLLRVGSGGQHPVTLLKSGETRALELARMGLVHIWLRQSLTKGRPEGPFYTLTSRGHELATSLYHQREQKRAA